MWNGCRWRGYSLITTPVTDAALVSMTSTAPGAGDAEAPGAGDAEAPGAGDDGAAGASVDAGAAAEGTALAASEGQVVEGNQDEESTEVVPQGPSFEELVAENNAQKELQLSALIDLQQLLYPPAVTNLLQPSCAPATPAQ